MEGTADNVAPGTDVSQRGIAPPGGPSTSSPADDGSSEGSSVSTDASSVDSTSSGPEALAFAPAPAAEDFETAPAPVPVLETVPVNAKLGNYDEPIEFPIIPVAVAVLPSGKVLSTLLLLCSSNVR